MNAGENIMTCGYPREEFPVVQSMQKLLGRLTSRFEGWMRSESALTGIEITQFRRGGP
jgi:hypothetical protein